jgi:hypothetical protein
MRKSCFFIFFFCLPVFALAQTGVRYTGSTLSNSNRHDGGLSPVVGVHNIQILRANREHPSVENGNGWTYNHQPMMAYWNGKFYIHYLSDEKDEQVPPSHTMMQTSEDGYHWSAPQILFPEYKVPEGFRKPGVEGCAHHLMAVMHQRQGFYVSKEGHLYALGTYGVCLNKKDHNNDGNGIGRVIREIRKDGSLGPVYFIYYNHGFNASNTDFPNYKRGNRYLKKACEEILNNPRMLMGWVEEADRNDPLIPLNKVYKAYNDYTLPDGRIVALWKDALTSISSDGGHTWSQPVDRAPGFVTSNAKIWGQRLSDGSYATVYNPSEYRWPLAVSLSSDGLEYTTLNLINGEVPPMRYGGNYKSYGPQYVRGILEGNGKPEDGNLWVTYSMNKEDIWVSRIPVPVEVSAHSQADDDFSKFRTLADLTQWNIYSLKMAPVSLDGKWLVLSDADPFDYARVDRKIPLTKDLTVSFDIEAEQNNHGILQIEFLDEKGISASRLEFTNDSLIRGKGGARYEDFMRYEPHRTYHIEVHLSVSRRLAEFYIDGKKIGQRMFYDPVHSFERIMLRTGIERTFPDVDTPADWDGILDRAGDSDSLAVYKIANFKTVSGDEDRGAAFLHADDFKHYVDYFNGMEDENVVQAIPNAQAWDWMKANVPLFSAPDKNFEQMWYYRWWTLRKHIENTNAGYAMTEFLVHRSYADKYNLIASALGHHIHESRWLRNPVYLDQIIHTWFHGNDGHPMKKIDSYSSWLTSSLWDRYLVDGRKDSLIALLPSLLWENRQWDGHRWMEPLSVSKHSDDTSLSTQGYPTLYWQYDVKDAMEETISGGRREKNARPSINSYMYGNDMAIANVAALAGNKTLSACYRLKADTLKHLVETCLWNDSANFFEVYKPIYENGLVVGSHAANVREAIGFLPWYFHLPDDSGKYGQAWLQAADPKGFSAPYGQTTAEQRHPLFRSHGSGNCEWDGAVWPFATSQTLTAMANFINDYRIHPRIDLDSLYFSELEKYVQCQYHRGKPYIGEYLDQTTGYWLKGDQERSRYYNHSTFNDLIITGLVGLRPRADCTVEVNPLLPKDKWNYFCLDNVLYHGHRVCIVWDRDGSRFHAGKGLAIYIDGRLAARRPDLGKLTAEL